MHAPLIPPAPPLHGLRGPSSPALPFNCPSPLPPTPAVSTDGHSQVEGMTRVAPALKAGGGGRAAKSENFQINEPQREPFYVHAYHEGTPDRCLDLQASVCSLSAGPLWYWLGGLCRW